MNRISITAQGSGDHLSTLALIAALLNEHGYTVENFTANNYSVGSGVNLPMGGTLLPSGEAEPVVAESAEALAPTESAADKKKRLAAEKRAAKKAEKDAKAAEAAALTEDEPEALDGEGVTIDDLKGEVKNAIERTSIDAVRDVFKKHDAAKISDLDEANYGEVLAELETLVAF